MRFHTNTLLLILLFSFGNYELFSQNTFSNRNAYFDATVAGHVLEFDSTFVISGVTLDTASGFYFFKYFFWTLNKNGLYLGSYEIGTPERQYGNFWDANDTLNREIGLIASSHFENETLGITIFWLEPNGDTLKTKKYQSPVFNGDSEGLSDWFVPMSISSTKDGNFYLSAQIYQENSPTDGDFCILKFDEEGNEIWNYIFATEIDPDLCYTIGAIQDGVIVVGTSQILEWGQWNLERIFKLDLDGNLIWHIDDIPDFNASIPQEMIVLEDGFAIVSSLDDFENPINGQNGLIYKMDFDGNLLWWNGQLEFNYATGLTCITKSCDNGFVCCGRNYESLVPPDSLDYDNNNNLIIAKYDSIGSLLWHRKYLYVNSPYDYHEMYDLKATRDGGYIMVGEATDNWLDNTNLELPRQQAWILKVDGCGCLVPGCDEFCTPPDCSPPNVVDVPKPDYFLYGPNPVENSFYIFFDGTDMELGDLEFQLFDISGRLVDGFVPTESDMTYIWEMEKYAAGEYVVVLKDKENILQSQKIVKL
jgi:hypothetical protein